MVFREKREENKMEGLGSGAKCDLPVSLFPLDKLTWFMKVPETEDNRVYCPCGFRVAAPVLSVYCRTEQLLLS